MSVQGRTAALIRVHAPCIKFQGVHRLEAGRVLACRDLHRAKAGVARHEAPGAGDSDSTQARITNIQETVRTAPESMTSPLLGEKVVAAQEKVEPAPELPSTVSASHSASEADKEEEVEEEEGEFDPESEMHIHVKYMLDGCGSIDMIIQTLYEAIDYYKELKEEGWEVAMGISDGFGYARKDVKQQQKQQ